jgi:hypothetical protein
MYVICSVNVRYSCSDASFGHCFDHRGWTEQGRRRRWRWAQQR